MVIDGQWDKGNVVLGTVVDVLVNDISVVDEFGVAHITVPEMSYMSEQTIRDICALPENE